VLDQLESPKQYDRPVANPVMVTTRGMSTKDTVLQEAKRRLGSLGHAALRLIECEYHDGLLILRGRVASYYQKQLAQESLRSQPNVDGLINKTEVESLSQ
jgi:hypothetical protein